MRWIRLAAASAALAFAGLALAATDPRELARHQASGDVRQTAEWSIGSGDARGRPFFVVDKKAARLFVFAASGRLLASTPVLLGSMPGDQGTPGVGERAQTGELRPEDRTTPAGRYVAHPGRNLQGEHVAWIDYEAALAIHRLRPGASYAARAARLESSTPDQRRVSLGCIIVPVAFYLDVVQPIVERRGAVVYVLPETVPAREFFMAG